MHRVPQVDALECVWQRRVTDRAQGTKVPLDQKTFSWQEDDGAMRKEAMKEGR
jgi:hypothetical protein